MEKVILVLVSMSVGVFIGLKMGESSSALSHPHIVETALEASFSTSSSKTTLKDPSKASQQSQSCSIDSNPVEKEKKPRKYFRKMDDNKIAAKKIYREIMAMNHFPEDGSPNMQVVEKYEKALSLDPTDSNLLEQFSNYLIMFDQSDNAKPLLDRCLEHHPESELCHGNLANHYLRKKNWKQVKNPRMNA